MSRQTSYTINMVKAFPGVIADLRPREIDSKSWEDTVDGAFGIFAARGTGDDQAVLPSTNTVADILGPIVAHQNIELDRGATSVVIEEDDSLNIMREGNIYVATEDACTPGAGVFVRYAGKSQVQTLVFDAALIASNVIDGDVGSASIASVTYASSNADTLTAIAAAIETANTAVAAVSDGTDTITVTTDLDAADQDLTNWVVTLGSTQAGTTVTETVEAIDSSTRGNVRTDADSTTAVAVDWEFEETGIAGAIVKIRKK